MNSSNSVTLLYSVKLATIFFKINILKLLPTAKPNQAKPSLKVVDLAGGRIATLSIRVIVSKISQKTITIRPIAKIEVNLK
ncbi:hypothetical protein XA3_18400 [Xylocopilactobacillus apicola]|uniref:Uncharacterized protein n=1 Tax=Xylocopilactobacillus apicola TaxID=2932184 RepID=A0AAU9CZJ5_9LACO|nr:hypothetical protein XA3_18400 [Xylocopilactobacillus apicola]